MVAKEFYTVGDVAHSFGVSTVCVRNWIKKGELQAFETPGGHRRIRMADFARFLEKYKGEKLGSGGTAPGTDGPREG